MRALTAALFAALASAAALAADTDDVAWVRADGGAGWQTGIARQAAPGVPAAPLLAPLWFAKSPNVKVRLAPEGTFDLASTRGKVVLLDYWASWCAPCIKELPHLQQLHMTRAKDGLVTLAINVDEDAAKASDSAKRIGLTMMIGLNDPEVKLTLGVRALPTLLAFDKQGRLRGRWDGYANGLENEVSAKVDQLLADDPAGTTREMASVIAGQGKLEARWLRDLPGLVDGVISLPADAGGARIVASGGDQLVSLDAAGETVARVKTESSAGRLLDFGNAADGSREIVGYRTGGTAVSVIGLRSGTQRSIALPAPLLDVVAGIGGKGGERRLTIATMRGAANAGGGDDHAALVEGFANVRAVATIAGQGVIGLRDDGTMGMLSGGAATWAKPAAGAERVFAAVADGAMTAPRSVVAAVAGRFLPGDGRQIAVATHTGHLALLDAATGAVQFESVWSGVKELAACDLDGDGRDELIVASGRSITALTATGR